jgi:[NiFe] hydrogenase assembly HybE family chaperone
MSPCTEVRHAASSLEALFARIAAERLAGVPILHPALQVQAVGFEAEAGGAAAVGVLVTPWFMNLMRLPLSLATPVAAPGDGAVRTVGRGSFAFIGACEPGLGAYEACSLFSPMFEFVDQAAAVATAHAVLAELRRTGQEDPGTPEDPARRAWLRGRAPDQGARR